MKFCSKCGARLQIKGQKPGQVTICENCGHPETTGARREYKLDYRPWQPKIIQRTIESIKAGRKLVLDAPTGSGKTLIALKVAESLLADHTFEHVYVAVRTINEMVPYERDISRFAPGLSYKYLLGKRRACPFYATGDDSNSALCTSCLKGNPARMIVDASALTRDLGMGLDWLERKYVKGLSRRSVVQNGVCLYQSMKEIPGLLRLITYPYLTNEKISEAKILDSLPDSLLIVDEAHNLENSADVFTDKLSPKKIENAIVGMGDFRFKFASEGAFAQFTLRLKAMAGHVSRFCAETGRTEHREKAEFNKMLQDDLKQDLLEIRSAYAQIEEERRGLATQGSAKVVPNPLFPIVDFVSNFEELYEKIELFAENSGITIRVLDPAEHLGILKEAGGLLLMSGTMPPKERIEKVWGLEKIDEIRVLRDYPSDYYSIFPRENKETTLVSTVTSKFETRGDLTWSSYASIIEQIHAENSKMTLVCCPSYFAAQNIHRRLSEEGRERTYLETSSTRLEEVMQIISDAGMSGSRMIIIGVARGKILEGVEFVRDGSSLVGAVILAGIPYPIPDDIHRWRCKIVMNRLGIVEDRKLEFELFMQEPALMVVKQAMGRAIRFPQDRASIYLVDSRFNQSFWRKELADG